MARLTVKVHPRAQRSAVTGRFGDAWKLDLAAPPVDGKANDECVRFFAELSGVPRSRVRIVLGAASRTKVIEIEGLPQDPNLFIPQDPFPPYNFWPPKPPPTIPKNPNYDVHTSDQRLHFLGDLGPPFSRCANAEAMVLTAAETLTELVSIVCAASE